jgi:hypothetical protein
LSLLQFESLEFIVIGGIANADIGAARLSRALWGNGARSSRSMLAMAPPLPLRKKLLPFGLLLGDGELVVREAELITNFQPSLGLGSQNYCAANRLGIRGSP